jgi:steroid 5-alpha reductase family enzyme
MSQHPYVNALLVILAVAALSWLVSVVKKDVSFVDSLWSLFFLIAALVFAFDAPSLGVKGQLVFALVAIWALRLSVYITARNWGEPEDYRYQTIRANNEPGFTFKSLYLVFGLQGVLAWFIALPLLPAITVEAPVTLIDIFAVVLWTVGFVFEAGGDYQLARFKSRKDSAGKVLDSGLWRYTRHPNYFGEFCMWWAFYLFAVTSGGWWSIVSPLLMSFLLLKVSGVAMLEKTISSRRPQYKEYVRRTNTFFPGPRRTAGTIEETQS